MKVLSLNIGKRTAIQWRGRSYETGILKSQVEGPIFLDVEDVRNDAVVDRKHHGGLDQAVYAYGYNHYEHCLIVYPYLYE